MSKTKKAKPPTIGARANRLSKTKQRGMSCPTCGDALRQIEMFAPDDYHLACDTCDVEWRFTQLARERPEPPVVKITTPWTRRRR